MENYIELQEMREQLVSLKQQLAGQKIINDKLMRRATAKKASKLKSKKNATLALGVFAMLVSIPIFYSLGFPIYFLIYTAAMIVFCMTMTVVYHSRVENADFMNGDLKNAAMKFKELRRNYRQWYWIAIPLVTIFIVLLYYSALQMDLNQEILDSFMIGAGIGGVIGAIIGVLMNNKVINLCDEIIKDLEEN